MSQWRGDVLASPKYWSGRVRGCQQLPLNVRSCAYDDLTQLRLPALAGEVLCKKQRRQHQTVGVTAVQRISLYQHALSISCEEAFAEHLLTREEAVERL